MFKELQGPTSRDSMIALLVVQCPRAPNLSLVWTKKIQNPQYSTHKWCLIFKMHFPLPFLSVKKFIAQISISLTFNLPISISVFLINNILWENYLTHLKNTENHTEVLHLLLLYTCLYYWVISLNQTAFVLYAGKVEGCVDSCFKNCSKFHALA